MSGRTAFFSALSCRRSPDMDTGQDRYGNTALHTACEEELQEVAKLLISHGASREIQNREKKKSSLDKQPSVCYCSI
jgi:ankyrin repeat protein